MAAVEKRKPPFLALLGNHIMFSVLCLFIVLNLPKGVWSILFGTFFLLLYLFGVYDYANRDGTEHIKSYSKIKPSYNYPVIYGLIAVSFLFVPALLFICLRLTPEITAIFGMFFLVTNAQFLYIDFLTADFVNWYILGGLCAVIILFSILGYFAGLKNFRLAAYLSKFLYVRKKDDKLKK